MCLIFSIVFNNILTQYHYCNNNSRNFVTLNTKTGGKDVIWISAGACTLTDRPSGELKNNRLNNEWKIIGIPLHFCSKEMTCQHNHYSKKYTCRSLLNIPTVPFSFFSFTPHSPHTDPTCTPTQPHAHTHARNAHTHAHKCAPHTYTRQHHTHQRKTNAESGWCTCYKGTHLKRT